MKIEQFLPAFLEELEQRNEVVPHHWNREKNREFDSHQVDAMLAISNKIREKIGTLSPAHISVQQAGGAGKTSLITNLVGAGLDVRVQQADRDGKIIVITTERALIQGIRKEFYDLGLDKDIIGQWGAGKKQIDRPIVLSSIQALQKTRDLQKLLPIENNRLVIGDEADTYLTKKRADVIRTLGGMVRVGLSATIEWPDGRHIEDLWGPLVAELPLSEGVRRGINVPPIFHLYEANIDESSIPLNHGEYDPKEVAQAYATIEIEQSIAVLLQKLIPNENFKEFPTLIYLPNTALVQSTTAKIQSQYPNVRIKQWRGDLTTNEDLQKDVADYQAGDINILVLCQMGGRGLNLPNARVIIDADPTISFNKLEQRHSRVMRRLRGKEEQKPFSVNIQIVPRSTKSRCVCLPDILLEDDEGSTWDAVERGEPLCVPPNDQGRAVIERAVEYSRKLKEGDPLVHLLHIETVDFAARNIRENAKEKTFEERVAQLRLWLSENDDNFPSALSKNNIEKSLATWLSARRQQLRDDADFAKGEGKVLLDIGVKSAEKRGNLKTIAERIEQLQAWLNEHNGKHPSACSENEIERSLARWLASVRWKMRDNKELAEECKALLDMGIKPAEKRDSPKTISTRIKELRAWQSEHPKKNPSGKSKNDYERGMGQWLSDMRRRLRDDEKFAKGEGAILLNSGIKPAEPFTIKSFKERMEELQAWLKNNANIDPDYRSENEEERTLGLWLNNMRRLLRDDEEFAKGEGKILLDMGIKPAREAPKNMKAVVRELRNWFSEHNKSPSTSSKNKIEKRLGSSLASIRRLLRDDEEFAKGEGKILLDMGVKPAEKRDSVKTFGERVQGLQAWLQENSNRLPTTFTEDESEKSLGRWLASVRWRIRDDEEFAQGEGKILLDMGIQPSEKRDSPKTLQERVNELRTWLQENANKEPSRNAKNDVARSLANWIFSMRVRLRDDEEFAKGEGKILLDMGIKPAKKHKKD